MTQKIIGIFALFIMTCSSSKADEPEKKDYLRLGGALRFNTAIENYENSNNALNTYAKLDTWFLSADASKSGFDLSLQYRFYPESKTHFLHHGYIGYQLDDRWYAKLGVFQKPFGIADYASHSWWFQIPYYMGLEDTYNTGLGASYKEGKLTLDVAYFRQAAPKGSISSNSTDNSVGNGRYSYAVVPTMGYADGEIVESNIRELDQINTRICYQVLKEVQIGASLQLGSIYNDALNKRKWGLTSAIHTVVDYNRWNFKGEVINYNYNAQANDGSKLDILQMAAYGAAYDVAAKGMIYTAGISYKIPVNKKFVNSIETYVDYSIVNKNKKGYHDTQHFIPGVLITSGPIYTHIDYAWGKNQPWLTSDFGQGLGAGSKDARWNSRFNINIGYYFN